MKNENKSPPCMTRYSRSRGAASVEAVVILPVLVILLASIYYVRNQSVAKMAAETKARACSWDFSKNNCNSVPAGCEGFVKEARGGGAVTKSVDNALTGDFGIVGKVLSNVLNPVLKKVYGRSLEANTQVSFGRPAIYGGGTSTVQGTYHLACNLENETLEDLAKDAWHEIYP